MLGVLLLAVWGLMSAPKALAWGLGGLLVVGILLAIYFRHRAFGYYFHFKLLAFIGPLVLLIAAVGAGRLRRAGPAAIAVLLVASVASFVADIRDTGYQLPQATIQLSAWADSLPKNASIRLDMWPPQQLWAAYFLRLAPGLFTAAAARHRLRPCGRVAEGGLHRRHPALRSPLRRDRATVAHQPGLPPVPRKPGRAGAEPVHAEAVRPDLQRGGAQPAVEPARVRSEPWPGRRMIFCNGGRGTGAGGGAVAGWRRDVARRPCERSLGSESAAISRKRCTAPARQTAVQRFGCFQPPQRRKAARAASAR